MTRELYQRFMGEALALADEAGSLGEVPVGALVVQGDRVLGRGFNRRESWQDPTAHAEIIAIRQAAEALGTWRLEGCSVVVTLEPCPMCAGAMVLARVQRCVYGCTDPKGGFLGTLGDLSSLEGLNHRFQVVPGVLADECSGRLSEFFQQLRESKS
jgi:tRNA(adenine34) deaminase